MANCPNTIKKTSVRLADSKSLAVEGMENIVLERKDSKEALIKNILYVPGMKYNLMSVGQLVENGFSVVLNVDLLQLFDNKDKLVLKSC